MVTEITLTLEDELIDTVRDMARARGTSLSELIADHLRSMVALSESSPRPSPVLSEITGILRSDPGEDHDDGIGRHYAKHLAEKFLESIESKTVPHQGDALPVSPEHLTRKNSESMEDDLNDPEGSQNGSHL